jgi:hypothetical protein
MPALPLRSSLVIIRRTGAGTFNDYNQEDITEADVATVKGELQYKDAPEMAQLNQAGVTVADVSIWFHTGTDIRGSDVVRRDPDDGLRYEVTQIRPKAMPGFSFTEVDARLVSAD